MSAEIDIDELFRIAHRQKYGMTAAQAQRAYDEAPEIPVSEEEIKRIVEYATSKETPPMTERNLEAKPIPQRLVIDKGCDVVVLPSGVVALEDPRSADVVLLSRKGATLDQVARLVSLLREMSDYTKEGKRK